MDERIIKIRFPRDKRSDGLSVYPWNFLPYAPPRICPAITTFVTKDIPLLEIYEDNPIR